MKPGQEKKVINISGFFFPNSFSSLLIRLHSSSAIVHIVVALSVKQPDLVRNLFFVCLLLSSFHYFFSSSSSSPSSFSSLSSVSSVNTCLCKERERERKKERKKERHGRERRNN